MGLPRDAFVRASQLREALKRQRRIVPTDKRAIDCAAGEIAAFRVYERAFERLLDAGHKTITEAEFCEVATPGILEAVERHEAENK